MPRGEKRPADVIGNAVHVMRIAAKAASNVGINFYSTCEQFKQVSTDSP